MRHKILLQNPITEVHGGVEVLTFPLSMSVRLVKGK